MKNTLLVLFAGMAVTNFSHAFELITVEEAAQNAHPPADFSFPKAALVVKPPSIEIRQPNTRHLASPFDIDIRFVPEPGSRVKSDTLRIFYGWMAVDITDRVRAWGTTINAQGITAKGATVPPGHHTLTIQVADDRERVGKTELSFSVE